MGCYRKADFDDPEVFATATIAVLSRYLHDIVMTVTDPNTGLPGKSKWPPTISEIRAACELENDRARGVLERKSSLKAQFEERDKVNAAYSDPDRRKEFIAEWRKRMREQLADHQPESMDYLSVKQLDQGAFRERVRSHHLARVARLSADSRSTPLVASELLLRSLAEKG